MARGRNLFGDPALEIQELTQTIKQDIAKLNSDIAALQNLAKSRSRQDGKHLRSHSGAVVVSLQVREALLSPLSSQPVEGPPSPLSFSAPPISPSDQIG